MITLDKFAPGAQWPCFDCGKRSIADLGIVPASKIPGLKSRSRYLSFCPDCLREIAGRIAHLLGEDIES